MKKYRPLLVTVFAVIILTFAACSNDSDSPQTDPFESQLRALPNVVSVEKITKKTDYKGSIYTVYFNSLLDPSDASKGKFKQKAYIGFTGYEKPVCLTTAGYMLSEQIVTRKTPENECAFILNGNLIAVEHRYFGESVRTDKKRSDGNYDGSYWEYLSTKNAADDLHAIITSLKRLLKGKWLAQGSSKGGLTSNLLCYYHPEDLDLTIPYVAPLCNGKYDSRLFDFIYDTAGNEDDRYKDKAAELRKLLNDIQIWMLERRDQEYENGLTYKEKLFNDFFSIAGNTYYNRDYLTADILYDISVSDFPMGIWQYGVQDTFDMLEKYYALADDNSNLGEGTKSKKETFFECLDSAAQTSNSPASDFSPYYFQSFTELGNYKPGLNRLRKSVVKAQAEGKNVKLVIEESRQDSVYEDCYLSDAERALAANYSNDLYEKMSDWIKTTDEKIIMIYGNSDPWYAVRINDVARDNVHIFVHPSNNHLSAITLFPEAQRNQILKLLVEYLLK
ncbi:MAG: hypothetical protein II684_02550 [Treponema sp.]|nr:hypothetical protein [Treponema sp.]